MFDAKGHVQISPVLSVVCHCFVFGGFRWKVGEVARFGRGSLCRGTNLLNKPFVNCLVYFLAF